MRRLVFAISLLGVAVLGLAQDLTAEQKSSVLKALEDVVTNRAFLPGVDFKKWPEFISKQQPDIEKAADVTAFSRVVNNALRDFGLSHLRLQTPRAASRRGQTSAVGTGALVQKEESGLKVRSLVEEGPAKAAGLEAGDLIVKVDGVKPDKPEALEGNEGKKMILEVQKANGEIKTVEVELKRFSTVRKETLSWVDDKTAVLRVFTFSAGYDRANIESLIKAANEKAQYLVLDLRSNGGGAVNNLNHLLSMLLPEKTVYGTFISKRLVDDYTVANPNAAMTPESIANWAPNKVATRDRGVKPFGGKIAVLTNRGSGSASEICTQALKESLGSKVVGTRTAGAVLASVYARLPEGFAIQYPVSDFVSAKGVRLEKNPIVPDAEISEPRHEDVSKDAAVMKALELLRAIG